MNQVKRIPYLLFLIPINLNKFNKINKLPIQYFNVNDMVTLKHSYLSHLKVKLIIIMVFMIVILYVNLYV